LYGVPVPFIADEHVDPEKGTGMVMCCTFGDVTDIQWYKTHGLPLRVVIDNAGKMKSDLPIGSDPAWPSVDAAQAQATVEALQGKKVNEARKLILEQLQEAGVLNGQEKIRQVVPVAERSGAPLEIIVTPQWFIRTLEYRDQILAKGQEITWHPEYMFNRFETWVQGLKWDWCISRQRHFGVPIPVWISQRAGEEGKVLLPAADALPVDPLVDLPEGYSRDEVEPVKDVMDTWATSSLTPQLTTRSITPERGYDLAAHERLFPSSMRPQAHEIIRTWAFYTIVKALHHQNDVPWRDICISGWCLASDGSKMSKSKGNIIDPLRLIADNGVDPVRYWTGTSRLGNDTALSPNTLKQGRRLVTKLWNAARLAHMSLGGSAPQGTLEEALQSKDISHPIDLWLIGELARTASEATEAFDRYEYAQALKGIETFFWSVFCDNYLELVKWRTGPESAASEADQASARTTLYFATTAVLRLFAPFVPYVTEKVYDLFVNEEGGERASVHARGAWPEFDAAALPPACPFADALLDVMTAVRKIKSDLGVSIKTPLGAVHVTPDPEAGSPVDLAALEPVLEDLRRVLNVEAIVFTAAQGNADDLVAASSGGLTATAQKPAEAPAD
ncbi:MAG: class I tRNA ligase family protein, partial [Rhodospirillaceae bacterium]